MPDISPSGLVIPRRPQVLQLLYDNNAQVNVILGDDHAEQMEILTSVDPEFIGRVELEGRDDEGALMRIFITPKRLIHFMLVPLATIKAAAQPGRVLTPRA